MRNTKYPDFVRKSRPKGTAVQLRNGVYLVYRVTSVRMPGKKNPQPVRGDYLGTIDERGFHPKTSVMVSTTETVSYEYGFTALFLYHEKEFTSRKAFGGQKFTIAQMRDIYRNTVLYLSPCSCLQEDDTFLHLDSEQLTAKYSVSVCSVAQSMMRLVNVDRGVMHDLKTVCCIVTKNGTVYAEPCRNLRKRLDDAGIPWEEIRNVFRSL